MLSLLEKNEFIVSKKSDNLIELTILENCNDKFKLELDQLDVDKLIINISERASISVLEIGECKNKNIIYNLEGYSSLVLNIASFDGFENNSRLINMKEASSFNGAYADFSKGINEFKLTCNLNERGANAIWHLATLTKLNDKKSFDISFHHFAKETYAKMENYGVCEDSSALSFLGVSKIYKGAKASATHQSAKIMVFDKKCNAKACPNLCIDENDVQASHAAVVGQINEEHVFYLTSRGICEKDAKRLITLGYLNPILNYFEDQETLDIIKTNIEERV